MNKVCSKCKEEKSLDAFSKKSASKDGLGFSCKACESQRQKVKYQKNRGKYLRGAKNYRQNNPEYGKLYRQRNPQKGRLRYQNLVDTYVISQLIKGTIIRTKDIRPYPGLIEFKRAKILLSRYIKKVKNTAIKDENLH